jgi:hypothetical protein
LIASGNPVDAFERGCGMKISAFSRSVIAIMSAGLPRL